MTRLFILGHNGMLGNAVLKFFSQFPEKYKIITTDKRWGGIEFNNELIKADVDFIINCIGAIPQKYSGDPIKYNELNIKLPIFLESLNKKIIHPSTDCEFSGNLPIDKKYKKNDKRDAADEYGKSKSYISEKIEKEFINTKIIRVSIIGKELEDKKTSLLEWAISKHTEPIKGYTDHYWNGITTLEWCKQCENLINNWNKMPILNQYGTEKISSKYDLVKNILNVYNRKTEITMSNTKQNINKCLESDILLPDIQTQLIELKEFYDK